MHIYNEQPDAVLENGAEVFAVLEQGAKEWLQARAGLATASEISTLLVKGKGPHGLGAGAVTYACQIVGELLTGETGENFSNPHTDRGHELEPEIRNEYEFVNGVTVEQVGFIRRGRVGYSPDGLVGEDGLWECKTHLPKKLIPMLLEGGVPKEHRPQMLAGLYVTGRDWIDLSAYWPGLPTLNVRLTREECQEELDALDEAVGRFTAYVDEVLEKLQGMGAVPYAMAAE